MKAEISALMDGELERREAEGMIDALKTGSSARETWRNYHLIGDAMRGAPLLSAGFAARVTVRLDQEPTVLAPRAKPIIEQRRWQLLSAAASVAAVAFVSIAFFTQDPTQPAAFCGFCVPRHPLPPRAISPSQDT